LKTQQETVRFVQDILFLDKTKHFDGKMLKTVLLRCSYVAQVHMKNQVLSLIPNRFPVSEWKENLQSLVNRIVSPSSHNIENSLYLESLGALEPQSKDSEDILDFTFLFAAPKKRVRSTL
jgi:gamma-glutamyl-gamma-aminobutyrate hydrolase PuuD